MANQRNAVPYGDNERGFLEDVLDTMDCIDCAVDRFSQKCAITHDILLTLAKTVQVVKSGIEALMEIDDDDEDDDDDDRGERSCQRCQNSRRN